MGGRGVTLLANMAARGNTGARAALRPLGPRGARALVLAQMRREQPRLLESGIRRAAREGRNLGAAASRAENIRGAAGEVNRIVRGIR